MSIQIFKSLTWRLCGSSVYCPQSSWASKTGLELLKKHVLLWYFNTSVSGSNWKEHEISHPHCISVLFNPSPSHKAEIIHVHLYVERDNISQPWGVGGGVIWVQLSKQKKGCHFTWNSVMISTNCHIQHSLILLDTDICQYFLFSDWLVHRKSRHFFEGSV